jgi:hypothetical protein
MPGDVPDMAGSMVEEYHKTFLPAAAGAKGVADDE